MKRSSNSMNLILITLYFFFFLTFNFPNVFAVASTRHLCHPEQRDAILDFKSEFEILLDTCFDGFPKTESWANNSDCCSWDGIRCDANSGDVIELKLNDGCLHGQLNSKSAIFMLQNLRVLDLSGNDFSGQIPSSLGNLSHLTSLKLSDTNLIGEIPSSLGNLFYLTNLYLSYNDLSGEIPSSLGNLSHLTTLHLFRNHFSGEILSSLGNLSHLTNLDLSRNHFTGHIPSSMANLRELESLDVSQNKLSGEIPPGLGNLSYLAYMNFSHNQLVGLLPGGTQFKTQPCSSFEYNLGLFGPSLDEVCVHGTTSQQSEMPEPKEDEEEVISWVAAAIGFLPGISFGLMMGYILVCNKPEWFMKPYGRNKRRSITTTTH